MQIIDELQKLEAAATVAPWVIEIDDEGYDGAAIYSNDGGWGTAYVCKDMEQIDGGVTDAELIVAMRNNLPKLIAALRAVKNMHHYRPTKPAYRLNDGGGVIGVMTMDRCDTCEESFEEGSQCTVMSVINKELEGE